MGERIDIDQELRFWESWLRWILKPKRMVIGIVLLLAIGIATSAHDIGLLPVGFGFIVLGLWARREGW